MPYESFWQHGIDISMREYTNPTDRSKCIVVVVSLGGHGVAVKSEDINREVVNVLTSKLHTKLLEGDAYDSAVAEIDKYGSHLGPMYFFPTTAPVTRLSAFVAAFEKFVKEVTPYFISFNPRLIKER